MNGKEEMDGKVDVRKERFGIRFFKLLTLQAFKQFNRTGCYKLQVHG